MEGLRNQNWDFDDDLLILNISSFLKDTTFCKYVFIAITSFLVDFGIFWFLIQYIHLNIYFAIFISFFFSFFTNFFLSRAYVFKKTTNAKKEYIYVKVIAISALVLNMAIMRLLVSFLDNIILSRLLTIIIVFFFNFNARYLLYRRLT